tara:strand:+ start:1164 stop:1871 length:708 start_codon:yes stop_codon:yes gene_type:complete
MKEKKLLNPFYNCESELLEIGIDEAGRGPMFGRVYSAGVILPKNIDFDFSLLKDSKKFSSEKKLIEVADYIKKKSLYWTVQYEDENVIDKINIRNATHSAMHKCIKEITNNYISEKKSFCNIFYLLVDGNDFKPYTYINNNMIEQISHILIEGGDNKYCSIAAASILAKVERDKYIKELCNCYKKLDTYYGLEKNKGYGTSKHMDGIKNYGISPWHRKTYGCCKDATINLPDIYL